MFTLVISWLTMYNLLWFIDLTFQVLMQCCSLQHQTYFHHYINYIPTNSSRGIPVLHTSPARIVVFWWWPFWLVWDETSLEFDLHFSNKKQRRASCHVFIVHLYIFFGEISLVIYFIYSSVYMSIRLPIYPPP